MKPGPKMKRLVCILLVLSLFTSCLAGCVPSEVKQVSCAEVAAAYEAAGYTVFHADTTAEDLAYLCYVKAEDQENGEFIYFHFFDTEAEANAYAENNRWNVILWLYSVASFQPYWLTVKTYGSIQYEYSNKALAKPFEELIK